MKNTGKSLPRVMLIVTIPTHLRTLMEVADLLRASQQFNPCLVYYPNSVFEKNHENCQNAPHDAYIWMGHCFISKEEYFALPHQGITRKLLPWSTKGSWFGQAFKSPAKTKGIHLISDAKKRIRSPLNKRFYTRLKAFMKFLPAPRVISSLIVRPILSLLDTFILIICINFFIIHNLFSYLRGRPKNYNSEETFFKNMNRFKPDRKNFPKKTHLQKAFLFYFAQALAFCPNQLNLRHRIFSRFFEGPLNGLDEQKIFLLGVEELLTREKADLLILPEENLFYNSQLLVYMARKRQIPVVVVPFTIVNTLEWAESFHNVPFFQVTGVFRRLLSKAFPHWTLMHKGRSLILPPLYILGCEYLNTVPDNPWLINSGHADAIAAESQFMYDYYKKAGIRKNKLRYTGSLADDRVYELLFNKETHLNHVKKRYAFPIRDKILLIGLPPDQFGAGKREHCEFNEYHELIRFMVETISAYPTVTVLINIHPRTELEKVLWLEDLGAYIIQEPIVNLVPLADAYIAVASATIRLGILSGIPVINYDAYQYNYDDYQGLPGVYEVKTKEAYQEAIEKMILDSHFYLQLKSQQQNTKEQQCLIDGNAGKRLLALFQDLIGPREMVQL